jgi:hypothetical protein
MGLPRGTTIALTPARRLMVELMYFSRMVPLVAAERRIDVRRVQDARQHAQPRPSWFAIFMKAYAHVCCQLPELRRSYLPLPWPRLHQHGCNVASLAIARKLGDEDVVLWRQIRHPETMPLATLDAVIRRARTEPIGSIPDFRRQLMVSRLPWPLNRWLGQLVLHSCGDWRARYAGTFGVTGVGALGSSLLNVLSPLTTTLSYGVFEDDGAVNVRLFFDHRVLDGSQPAAALERLGAVLHGPIVDELGGAGRAAA